MNQYRFSFDPFCREGAGSDGRAAPEGLELGVDDLSVVVNLDLELMKSKWSIEALGTLDIFEHNIGIKDIWIKR